MMPPTEGETTPSPSAENESTPTSGPITDPTTDNDDAPVDWQIDQAAVYEELFTLLINREAVTSDIEDFPDSPQYQAMVWLSEDPNYYDYLQDRVVQRWVMAVTALSLFPAQSSRKGRKNRRLVDGWLEYTNECTWFTTSSDPVCDGAGRYETLDVQDLKLGGSLPVELSLLSNSLSKFLGDLF
jgi:hypothetical protein